MKAKTDRASEGVRDGRRLEASVDFEDLVDERRHEARSS
jgi:hypothetical protein